MKLVYAMAFSLTMSSGSLACDLDAVESMLDVSGFANTQANAPIMWKAAFAAYDHDRSELAEAAETMMQSYQPQHAAEVFSVDAFCLHMTPDAIESTIAFYTSPLGQAISAAEAVDPDMAAGQVLADGLGAERKALLDTLATSADSPFAQFIQAEEDIAIYFGREAKRLEVWDNPETDLATRIRAAQFELGGRDYWQSATPAIVAYVYRDFSDDDLRAYTAFLADPNTRLVYATHTAVMSELHEHVIDFILGAFVALQISFDT